MRISVSRSFTLLDLIRTWTSSVTVVVTLAALSQSSYSFFRKTEPKNNLFLKLLLTSALTTLIIVNLVQIVTSPKFLRALKKHPLLQLLRKPIVAPETFLNSLRPITRLVFGYLLFRSIELLPLAFRPTVIQIIDPEKTAVQVFIHAYFRFLFFVCLAVIQFLYLYAVFYLAIMVTLDPVRAFGIYLTMFRETVWFLSMPIRVIFGIVSTISDGRLIRLTADRQLLIDENTRLRTLLRQRYPADTTDELRNKIQQLKLNVHALNNELTQSANRSKEQRQLIRVLLSSVPQTQLYLTFGQITQEIRAKINLAPDMEEGLYLTVPPLPTTDRLLNLHAFRLKFESLWAEDRVESLLHPEKSKWSYETTAPFHLKIIAELTQEIDKRRIEVLKDSVISRYQRNMQAFHWRDLLEDMRIIEWFNEIKARLTFGLPATIVAVYLLRTIQLHWSRKTTFYQSRLADLLDLNVLSGYIPNTAFNSKVSFSSKTQGIIPEHEPLIGLIFANSVAERHQFNYQYYNEHFVYYPDGKFIKNQDWDNFSRQTLHGVFLYELKNFLLYCGAHAKKALLETRDYDTEKSATFWFTSMIRTLNDDHSPLQEQVIIEFTGAVLDSARFSLNSEAEFNFPYSTLAARILAIKKAYSKKIQTYRDSLDQSKNARKRYLLTQELAFLENFVLSEHITCTAIPTLPSKIAPYVRELRKMNLIFCRELLYYAMIELIDSCGDSVRLTHC